jgi:hypothetical protein
VDKFREYEVTPKPYPTPVEPSIGSYATHFYRRLRMIPPQPQIASALKGIETRGDALERLKDLKDEMTKWELARLTQVAIVAKHDEWRGQLEAPVSKWPVSNRKRMASSSF